MKSKKIRQGYYIYRGWEIEKMPAGQWNMKEEDEDFWADARNTLWEAKNAIDRWMLNDEKT